MVSEAYGEHDGLSWTYPEKGDAAGGYRFNLYTPQIYSIDPVKCEDARDCLPAEKNNVTINKRNGTTEDYDNDGIPDEDPENRGYEKIPGTD